MSNFIYDAIRKLSPNSEFSLDDNDLNTLVWFNDSIPRPTNEEIEAEAQWLENQAPLDECKAKAKQLLSETDWVEIPSVTNTDITPHLLNANEFIAYRSQLRELVVRPIANPVFPVAPQEQWSS